MLKLDDKLLEDVGLGSLSREDKDSLLAKLYDQLELRVGTVIAKQLTDEQLDEFEKLIDSEQQDKALAWLSANYPDYKQVVANQLKQLADELKASSPQILSQLEADA